MAENSFENTVESLFKGMDSFITTKTVVGDAIKIDEDTTILPLVDVSFGVAAGAQFSSFTIIKLIKRIIEGNKDIKGSKVNKK